MDVYQNIPSIPFTSVINEEIWSSLERFIVISSPQYVFRVRSNTTTAATELADHALQNLDQTKTRVVLGLIDLKKAFDTANHEKLLEKCERIGIRGVLSQLLHS